MKTETFDLIVLGGGSAARAGADKAAREYGANVALVERTRWGGSCPNVACKPTKAILVAAELVHDVNTLAEVLGIEVGPARANLARVKARKDELLKPQPRWVEELQDSGFATVDGAATFADPRTVRVGERTLEAERILVATGSRTAVPPIDGIDDVGWIDHVSALELTELPESLLVLGGGAVGLEFGQAFSRFGSRVTIVDALDRISPKSDADASAELHAALEDEGIGVVTSTFVSHVRREDGDIVATLAPRDGSEPRDLRATQILLASGRVPNVEELDLERVGVERSKLGVVVDERMRTSVDGIWAAGDVTAVFQFTPVAQYQARVAIADMFRSERRPRRLLRASDGDLHRPRAGVGRPHGRGGGGTGGRLRDRFAPAFQRAARELHEHEARALQARLRARLAQAPRPPRRRPRRGGHRAGACRRDAPRRNCGRPGAGAPCISNDRGGCQGSRRTGESARGRLIFRRRKCAALSANLGRRPRGRRAGAFGLCLPRAALAWARREAGPQGFGAIPGG